MAKEITGTYTPGTTTLYAVLKLAGQAYNGSSFEDMLTANWATYLLGLAESDSTGHYYLDMPAGLSAGIYEYVLYNSGGSAAPTNSRFGSGVIYWDGTQDVGSQLIASLVWAYATRLLTAGTNITLAKGTGITGFNDLSAAQVNAEVDTALADYDAPTKTELDSAVAAIEAYGDINWITATGFSTLTASDIRNAVGLASANLDTQLSTIDANVDSILDDTGISGVVVASGSKTGYSLASSGLDAITIETGMNARQAVSIIASAVGGVLAGAGTTTITIAAAGVPATNRITATVDSDENRTAVTLNLPA